MYACLWSIFDSHKYFGFLKHRLVYSEYAIEMFEADLDLIIFSPLGIQIDAIHFEPDQLPVNVIIQDEPHTFNMQFHFRGYHFWINAWVLGH